MGFRQFVFISVCLALFPNRVLLRFRGQFIFSFIAGLVTNNTNILIFSDNTDKQEVELSNRG